MVVKSQFDYKFKRFKRVRIGDVIPTILKAMVDAGWVDKTSPYSGEYPHYMELFSDGKSGTDSIYLKVYLKDGIPATAQSATNMCASKNNMNVRTRCVYTLRKGVNDAEYAHWYMPVTNSGDYGYYYSGSTSYMSDTLVSDYLCDVYVYADKENVTYAIKHGFYYSKSKPANTDVVWSLQVPQRQYVAPTADDMVHKISQISSCAGQAIDGCNMYHSPKGVPVAIDPTANRMVCKVDYLKETITPSMNNDMQLLSMAIGEPTVGLISKPDGIFVVKPNSSYIRSGNTVTIKLPDGTTRKAVYIEADVSYRSYGISIGGYCLILEDS